jgi:hypothetical protein
MPPLGRRIRGQGAKRLEELLRDWDKKRESVRDFRFEFKRTDSARVKNEETVVHGVAIGTRPNRLRLDEHALSDDMVGRAYDQFLAVVKEGRGDRPLDE